jgi:8-oxo-dGTP pyrophosphatase MutT (NUDIX family)
VDEGEDVLTAAMREIKEETGVLLETSNVKLKVLAFHHHLDRGEVWMEYLFRATIPSEQKIISTPEGESKWISLEELKTLDQVFPPSKYYFDHILNDKPGIVYNASEWSDSQLVRVQSEKVDGDF